MNKTTLKLTWTYSIELWGSAKASNLARTQTFESKVLPTILNAPWYVSNRTLHHDSHIPAVQEEIEYLPIPVYPFIPFQPTSHQWVISLFMFCHVHCNPIILFTDSMSFSDCK